MPGTCPCSPVQPRSPISSNQPPAAWTEAPAYQTASQPPCRGLGTAKVGPPAVPRPSATRGSNGRLDSRAQSVRSLTALWLGQDGVAATGGRWPGFLTVTGMVGVVTAVLAGIGLGCLVAVVLDRASALQVLEDRLHVQGDRDLVADHHAATGQMVLPRHVEVVAVDRGRGREADPPQGAAVLLAHPVGRLPLAVVGHVQDHRPGDPPDGQVDAGLGVHVPGALDDVAGEGDPGMVLDVEEVGAAKVRVACLFAGPDPGGVDLAVEGRLQRTVPVELDRAVDVLEEAAHPGDHHVPRAELRLGVAGLENPAAHRWILSSGPTGCHPPHTLAR